MEISSDSLFGGRVRLAQPARATKRYRVNVDALLLGAFAARRASKRAYDLGAGVGAVGLTLLHLEAAKTVTMVEVDGDLAALAVRNAEANGWRERVDVVAADVAAAARRARGEADLVVCNPPYVTPGRGRAPLAPRARARTGDLETFLDAARALLGRRGRACFVYPAGEQVTLLEGLRRHGLEPKRLAHVHATSATPARIVLVEALPARRGGLVVEPPIVERDERGASPFVSRLLAGELQARGGRPL